MRSFLKEAKALLKHFPDHNELETVHQIEEKSCVLPIGLDLKRFSNCKSIKSDPPLILWNHRWEYDKNPESFFNALFKLDSDEIDFRVVLLGESFGKAPVIFEDAQKRLKEKIVYFGFCKDSGEYAQWLWNSDILPVTNIQDFFGISVMEAMYCNTYPLLPNRLTYPELLPKSLHEDHMYKSEDELLEKLKWCISNIDEVRKKEFSEISVRFDWDKMAPEYDELFSSFL
jgi:glycosyltransferase involved in cell wall biosynthesis